MTYLRNCRLALTLASGAALTSCSLLVNLSDLTSEKSTSSSGGAGGAGAGGATSTVTVGAGTTSAGTTSAGTTAVGTSVSSAASTTSSGGGASSSTGASSATSSGSSSNSSSSSTSSSSSSSSGSLACGASACAEADYQTGGKCAAQKLYQSSGTQDAQYRATGLVIDAQRNRLLWGKWGAPAIMSTPIAGGTSTTLLDVTVDPSGVLVQHLFRDDTNLYWSAYGTDYVSRLPLVAGDTPAKALSGPGINQGVKPLLFGSTIYSSTMVTSDPDNDTNCSLSATTCWSELVSGPANGSGAQGKVVFDGKPLGSVIGGIASDGVSIYFTTFNPRGTALVRVYRIATPGASATKIFEQAGSDISDIVAEQGTTGRLYWIGPNGLFRSEKDGTGLITKAVVGWGQALTMDDTYLYWINDGVHITRIPKGAGPQIDLSSGNFASGLTLDCNHVFWAETKDPESATTQLAVFRATR